MKMGDIVPRTGIEPTSLAFQASVLIITPSGLREVTMLHMSTWLCGSLPDRSVQTIYYIYNTRIYIYICVCVYVHTVKPL